MLGVFDSFAEDLLSARLHQLLHQCGLTIYWCTTCRAASRVTFRKGFDTDLGLLSDFEIATHHPTVKLSQDTLRLRLSEGV
jgi:hypothetical protein